MPAASSGLTSPIKGFRLRSRPELEELWRMRVKGWLVALAEIACLEAERCRRAHMRENNSGQTSPEV